MNRRDFIKITSVSTVFTSISEMCVKATQAATTNKPNILLIYADDLGYHDLACYGNTYHETPNIDKLCSKGMKFTNAYSCGPVCAPSRACLISGQYVTRHGIYCVNQVDKKHTEKQNMNCPENIEKLPLNIVTIADTLKAAGYATGYCGKWHLGNNENETVSEYHPSKRGFDDAVQTRSPSGNQRYFYPNFSTIPKIDIKEGTYLTDVITERALKFLDQNKDGPFFLYLPHFNVHGPHEAKQKTIEKYKRKEQTEKYHNPVYAAMNEHLDEAVGILLKKLDDLKIADNTIVIFTSDNGAITAFTNTPLRECKGYLYEGGIRVPLIIRYPEKVKPDSVCSEPVIHIDFYPTLTELAGGSLPVDQTLDGVSITALLKSNGKTKINRETLFWHFPTYLKFNNSENKYKVTPCGAIRDGNYKLIEFFEDGRCELYNLKNDIGETKDLANKIPGKVEELKNKLHKWRKDTNAMMPKLKNT